MEKFLLQEVFGVSNNLIKSYISRPEVDGMFQGAVQRTDKQIIIYGSSKQGKTALLKSNLPEDNKITVQCAPGSSVGDIYRSVARQLSIRIEFSSETSKSSSKGTSVGFTLKAFIPFIDTGAELSGKTEAHHGAGSSTQYRTVEYDLSLAQDFSELMKNANADKKFIILENFHYLDEKTQQRLAYDLRSLQELGIRFIILGVWREKNRLSQFNGDLSDRITEIPVEPWNNDEFRSVIKLGSEHLNISFGEDLISGIINNAFDSIGVVQELLRAICEEAGILETQPSLVSIHDITLLERAIRKKVNDYKSRHLRALEKISNGRSRGRAEENALHLPHYLIKAVLTSSSEIENGITRKELTKKIKESHHRSEIRPSDMSNLLYGLAKLQEEMGISPPLFDYDRAGGILRVIDSTLYFFLRNIDTNELLEEIGSPANRNES